MTEATLYDDTPCQLGEGPLWHPERKEFFWFDINECRLYRKTGGKRDMWQFDDYVSAAGWIDRDHLMIAYENALLHFNIETGTHEKICDLEADNPVTRPNDGRADPWGGFWIGSMGKQMEAGAGSIYRYYRGEVRKMYSPWTIPNAMCFTPDRRHAYLADTPRGIVWRQALSEKDGWPEGDPVEFLNLPASEYRPDGAVVDAEGNLWCAHFGHAKVTCHTPEGREIRSIPIPARQATCPSFTGEDLQTVLVTTAAKNLPADTDDVQAGMTFSFDAGVTGQKEHQVIL